MIIFTRVTTFAREGISFVEKLGARLEAVEAFLEGLASPIGGDVAKVIADVVARVAALESRVNGMLPAAPVAPPAPATPGATS